MLSNNNVIISKTNMKCITIIHLLLQIFPLLTHQYSSYDTTLACHIDMNNIPPPPKWFVHVSLSSSIHRLTLINPPPCHSGLHLPPPLHPSFPFWAASSDPENGRTTAVSLGIYTTTNNYNVKTHFLGAYYFLCFHNFKLSSD